MVSFAENASPKTNVMITILTPVFNRAHTLRRLFQSLETQTDSNFEWLVVDDGSTDDTPKLLREFACSESVRMHSIRQDNCGKHVAINVGVRAAHGEWVFIVDSDDALTPNAVSSVLQACTSSSALSGVCFRRGYFHGGVIGRNLESDVSVFLHPTQAGRIFFGDLAYVFNREVMLRHPFPVIPGEKFVPELYIWNRIGDEADILFFPDKVIYLCEYLPDGYTANFTANLSRNPQGFLLFYATQLHRERRWLDKAKCLVRCLQCLARLAAGGGRA
jgi:glycosyltransferase involved in cell wall biosynthesis